MKRVCWFVLLLLGAMWVQHPAPSVAAQADPTPSSAVVCNEVTLRTAREVISATVITHLPAGTTVEVLEYRQFWINADWSFVRVGDLEGWVVSSFLTYLPRTTTVHIDTLNVRQLPYAEAPIVTTFARGDRVEILGREDDFTNGLWGYARRLSDGAEGWVSSEVVANMRRLVCQAPVLYTRPAPRQVMFWPSNAGRQLFVWSSNRDEVVAFVHAGDTITILADEVRRSENGEQSFAGWRVRVNATAVEGIVTYTRTLIDLPCNTRVWSAAAVVRDRPAPDAATIATLAYDTPVTVIGADNQVGNSGAWLQISGASNGWVQDEDLQRCAQRRNG